MHSLSVRCTAGGLRADWRCRDDSQQARRKLQAMPRQDHFQLRACRPSKNEGSVHEFCGCGVTVAARHSDCRGRKAVEVRVLSSAPLNVVAGYKWCKEKAPEAFAPWSLQVLEERFDFSQFGFEASFLLECKRTLHADACGPLTLFRPTVGRRNRGRPSNACKLHNRVTRRGPTGRPPPFGVGIFMQVRPLSPRH
jgi:hypothetical protein